MCHSCRRRLTQSPELIVACLLHDLGHLVHHLGDDPAIRGIDDRHEYRAISVLEPLFPKSVTIPIELHVAAKRYLCATEDTYWAMLSDASKQSLELQGGVFSEEMAEIFIKQPYASAAVKLRRWDDLAKITNLTTPDLGHFQSILIATCETTQA